MNESMNSFAYDSYYQCGMHLGTGTIGQWEMGDPGGGSRAPGRRGGWRRQPAMARRRPGVGPASAGCENMTKKKNWPIDCNFFVLFGNNFRIGI